jgi:hypothetical protein
MTKPATAKKFGTGFDRMNANMGPAKTEKLRQQIVSDQAKARSEVSGALKAAKPATDARKITVLAKSNPHAAGSRRANWFKQLKNGMTVTDAVKLGVRSVYNEWWCEKK